MEKNKLLYIKALTLMILIASGCEEKCGPDKNAMAKGSVVCDSNVSAVPEVAYGDQCGNDKDGGCVFPDAASPTDAAFRKREFDWLRKVESFDDGQQDVKTPRMRIENYCAAYRRISRLTAESDDQAAVLEAIKYRLLTRDCIVNLQRLAKTDMSRDELADLWKMVAKEFATEIEKDATTKLQVEFECQKCNAPETSSREIMEGLVK